MVELLTDEGYRVTTRSHLDRDLQEITGLAPDLIVIDYMWPTTDDNWSLLQLLRLHPPTAQIPILLCTGAVREAQQLESHLADLRITVLYKPFDIDRLTGAVHLALTLDPTP
jgi:CheY-like chemotaxis protein